MCSIFEGCGLIESVYLHVSSLVKERVPSIPANYPKFAQIYEDTYKETFSSIEWQNFFEKNNIEPLNEEIKQAIKTLFDRMNGDTYLNWLIQVHLLLSFYLFESELEQPYKDTNFKLILEYYQFLRSETEKKQILIPSNFAEKPLEKFWRFEKEESRRVEIKRKREEEISKRLCPYCGARGSDVKKWDSERYKCKICSKTFPRKPKN